jgi:protein-S-isoprenylcysteine O-methyltransferase Ste14
MLTLQWVLLRNIANPLDILPWIRVAGWGFVIGGTAVFITAAFSFRRHRTTILPFEDSTDKLIQSGIFRVSRNPIYLGEVIILTGTALLTGQLSPWVAVLLFAGGIDRNVIRWEEQALQRRFGADFEAYCRKTRRWL